MYNTKFVLNSNKDVYPGYLDREHREIIKKQFNDKKEFMWCGCRSDQKLFYRISEDLKIYPEHNNYEHKKSCCRYKTSSGEQERQTAYVIDEESGQVLTYLTFNPKKFELNEETEKDQATSESSNEDDLEVNEEVVIEKDEGIANKVEEKEPKLTLPLLIRSINVDTFTEKILNNKSINSRELFSKYVFHRMKNIKVSKMKKNIGDLSLEADGVRFLYAPFARIVKKTEKGLTKCYIQNWGPDGEVYSNLIYPDTLKKVVKDFVKAYGIEPNEDTMLAGFQYKKKSRNGSSYRVLGRVHLFQTSKVGIYCRNLNEKEAFDSLYDFCEKNKDVKFWIPPEDDSIGGILQVENKKKKFLLLFKGKKSEFLSYDTSMYDPIVIGLDTPLTEEILCNIIEKGYRDSDG